MRVAFDVSPLSHERTGVNNYIRGSLQGLADAAVREGDEVVAFAPTSPAGRRVIPEVLGGIPVELRLRTLPFAHVWRTAWSRLGRPPAERFLGSFDVLHFSDWMYPPQASGLRSTMVHDLVPLLRRLHDPPQRADDVVADARPRVRERAHVDDDPHLAGGSSLKPVKCAPRTRVSAEPG